MNLCWRRERGEAALLEQAIKFGELKEGDRCVYLCVLVCMCVDGSERNAEKCRVIQSVSFFGAQIRTQPRKIDNYNAQSRK